MAEALVMPQRQAPANPQARQGEAASSPFTMNRILMGGAVYFALNFGLGQLMKKDQTGINAAHPVSGAVMKVPGNLGDIPPFQFRPDKPADASEWRKLPNKIAPIWAQDSQLDITVTLSPSYQPAPISQTPPEYIVLEEKGFQMNNYSDARAIDTTFKVPKTVQNNGTLWAHIWIGLAGSTLDVRDPAWTYDNAFHFSWPLTQYLPKKHVAKTRNLLEGLPEGEEEEEVPKTPIVTNHYHPNITLALVPDLGVKEFAGFPPASKAYLRLEASGARDHTGRNGWYYPIMFVNTFWQLKSHMVPVNETVTELPLHIDLKNMVSWQFHMLAGMDASAKESARQAAWGGSNPGGGDGSEIEMIKEVFIDTNPILLGITAIVTVAHLILETLAFGSDIAHYRKKKDNVGISVRSILANVFMQTIIFLYLLDNSDNTSWMILGTQIVGIAIEFWKITTVVDVRVRPTAPGSLLPYQVTFEDKHKLTETEEKTKEYDEIAFKYMYIGGIPLLIAYGIYSLIYDTHKSWYSYIITTLVGSVYAYGFLMMVPSLYINYRLKSVAHMPGKAMMYKFLNTFIDDLFAFTIKMPFLHRLATFRDDVIFFIYLYQRWQYKIDYSRVNEFGQGGDDDEEPELVLENDAEKEEEEARAHAAADKARATGADVGKAKKRK